MDLTPIWGSLIVFIVCPLLGGIPLIDWITYALTGRQLRKLGTGNVSVSAAFYHGGKLAGILAVLSEAAKGIIAVLLTRLFFPSGSAWEIVAIIAVVMGRYWMGKSAGTTNAVWGIVAHDPIAAGLTWLISLVSFTIIRDRLFGKYAALVLLVVIIGLRNPERLEYTAITFALACLLGWIYQNIPDDLELEDSSEQASTTRMFRFFQGDRKIITLDSKLDRSQVGAKAANLALLKRQGYPVVEGWVLRPGDNFASLVATLNPTVESPLIVRSSAIGEDSEVASAAGQYLSILNVTSRELLESAIIRCQTSYLDPHAVQYRRQTQQIEESMAILVQRQIEGVYSGVAFSRDPVNCFKDGVAVEALPGKATKIVSGKFTPQRYSVFIPDTYTVENSEAQIEVTAENTHRDRVNIPQDLIESVALLAREMEELFAGIPQDIEWTYDGEKLWLLQVRPITNLQPIWTRRIAAEVIPGKIRPLTWSINQPLTCGVWGKLFTIVLGDRAKDLNFEETATLHFANAYFNASLLGKIFLRMGLPPESLEFLTRGAKFSKPPLLSTIKNLPGLWRLGKREWNLPRSFNRDRHKLFEPILSTLAAQSPSKLSPTEIIDRIETILGLLDKVTYYNILAPLSLAIRQGVLKVNEADLDRDSTPEVKAVKTLAEIAADTRKLLTKEKITFDSSASLFAHLAENPEGSSILERFNFWLSQYGYLSEAATDIAVPRWQDRPSIPRKMFTRFFFDAHQSKQIQANSARTNQSFKAKLVQRRLNLKGTVAEIYNKLLAHLRWSFLALEQQWLDRGVLKNSGDIFQLKISEIEAIVAENYQEPVRAVVESRKAAWQQAQQLTSVPKLIYGYPDLDLSLVVSRSTADGQQEFKGIGASSGEIEGLIKIVSSLEQDAPIDSQTIIVVPYTDAGWSPLLARAGGLISEVGGRLSHGAIVAREYNIPAVMDVENATNLFRDGQKVRLNGQTGIVEILS